MYKFLLFSHPHRRACAASHRCSVANVFTFNARPLRFLLYHHPKVIPASRAYVILPMFRFTRARFEGVLSVEAGRTVRELIQ